MLIDVGLPDLSGHEVARRLRKMPQAAGAMLIAVTGYGQAEDRRLSAAAGFDRHWIKPVSFEALAALLDGRSGKGAARIAGYGTIQSDVARERTSKSGLPMVVLRL